MYSLSDQPAASSPDARFARLWRYSGLQASLPRWQASSCAVIGLGGLGCAVAPLLARLGVRRLILIDRDVVSRENLGHQGLFDQSDAAAALPKVEAARQRLSAVNSAVEIEAHTLELNRRNIRDLLADADLLFDGLDNYYTRLLLNDFAWASSKPYFYAGVVSGELSARAVLPGRTGCLRCLVDSPPPPGAIPTCSSAGVFPPLLGLAALLQMELAGRWLASSGAGIAAEHECAPTGAAWPDILYSFDMASLQLRQTSLRPRADCPVCGAAPGQGRYDYLDGGFDDRAASACDGSRQQLELPTPLDLARARAMLEAAGGFILRGSPFSLTAERGGLRYTLFPQGRLVLEGSEDPAELNRFVDTYLGA